MLGHHPTSWSKQAASCCGSNIPSKVQHKPNDQYKGHATNHNLDSRVANRFVLDANLNWSGHNTGMDGHIQILKHLTQTIRPKETSFATTSFAEETPRLVCNQEDDPPNIKSRYGICRNCKCNYACFGPK